MCAAARAATASAPHTRQFLISEPAIRNDCKFHRNNTLAFSNRLKFTCSGAFSSPHQPLVTDHDSPITTHQSRIFNRYPNIRNQANPLTTNEKTFSNRYFFWQFGACPPRRACAAPRPSLATHHLSLPHLISIRYF
jgi:hypothetical protein